MTHDADIYPDPSEFCPDRFMMPNAQEPDPLQFSFGFGRRYSSASLFFMVLEFKQLYDTGYALANILQMLPSSCPLQ